MKQNGVYTALGAFVIITSLFLTGCSPKDSEIATQKGPPPTPETAINDSRIPPEQKAALERNMAAQKARVEKIDAQMKAKPSPNH